MSVFVSQQVPAAKRQEAESILSSFGATAFTAEDTKQNALRVVTDFEIDIKQRLFVPTITVSSIKSFVELHINPFSLKKGDKIKNLHLYGKTVSFSGITMPLLSELTRIVLKMGGKIGDRYSRIDYRIIKPEKAFSNGYRYIKYDWLYALFNSANFVDPKDFYFSDRSSSQSQMSQSSPDQIRSQGFISHSPASSKLLLVESSSSQYSEALLRTFSQSQHSTFSSPMATSQTSRIESPLLKSKASARECPLSSPKRSCSVINHSMPLEEQSDNESQLAEIRKYTQEIPSQSPEREFSAAEESPVRNEETTPRRMSQNEETTPRRMSQNEETTPRRMSQNEETTPRRLSQSEESGSQKTKQKKRLPCLSLCKPSLMERVEMAHRAFQVRPLISEEESSESSDEEDDFVFEKESEDINDIEVFAKDKICCIPLRRENVCDNSNSHAKPISLASVINFTQNNEEDSDATDEVYYANKSKESDDKSSSITLSQDPLMKLLC